MIAIAQHKFARLTLIILLALGVLSGCTNSKLIIAPLYNRFDDQMRGEFHKLAKWNDEQIAHFESRVGTYHVWHRQNELPNYANLLKTIHTTLKKKGATTPADIGNWVDEVEGYTQNARVCHPVNFSYDLMRTLNDEQVNFIERRFARERKKNFNKYNKLTTEERRKERLNNVVKWASRVGFKFTNKQKRMLDTALKEQISLTPRYYYLVDIWAKDLFKIARKQEAADYEQKMSAQMNKLWTLLEHAHETEWQANRVLWRNFGYEFVESFSTDQRLHTSRWLGKMGKTIDAISKDKPSFRVKNDPTLGCMTS